MEAFLILLLLLMAFFIVVGPIVTWVKMTTMKRHMEDMEKEFSGLRIRMDRMMNTSSDSTPSQPPKAQEEPKAAPLPPPVPKPVPSASTPEPSAAPASQPLQHTASVNAPASRPAPVERKPSEWELAGREAINKIWNWLIVGEEHRKPGVPMEYAIATNWLVRIGVLIMVVGIAFFLQYSASQGWLGPQGRFSITMLAGAGVLGTGIRLLGKKYHLLAQGFLGAGLATWYVALFIGHMNYELFGAPQAFLYMGIVTACAAILSVRFGSLLVAVLGILGGYGTPLLLPGAGNLLGLYTYLLVLGLGVLAVAHRRNWHLLNMMSFFATVILVGASIVQSATMPALGLLLPFLTAYFLLFSTVIFIYQVLHKSRSSILELLFLLLNALAYFSMARLVILESLPREWVAGLTLFLAAFYTGHLWVLMKGGKTDRGLTVSFTALAAFFLTLTLPILLSHSWLTVSWSLLAMIFYWASAKLNSRFLSHIAIGLYGWVGLRYFAFDLPGAYEHAFTHVTWHAFLERLAVFGTIIFSVFMALRWVRTPPEKHSASIEVQNDIALTPPRSLMTWIFGTGLFLMVFLMIQLELYRSISFLYAPLIPVMSMLGWMVGGLVLLILYHRSSSPALRACLLALSSLAVAKFLLYDLINWDINLPSLEFEIYGGWSGIAMIMRLFSFGLLFAYLVLLYRYFCGRPMVGPLRNVFGYGALAMLLLYTTLEINTLLEAFIPGLRGGGISVYWGLFALSLVSAGLMKRVRPLRMMGLAMFTLVAGKVFVSDLSQLDPVYRIVAFILLGIVLIAGAFAYLKFEDRFQTGASE